jgi:hypothetical protein
MADLKNITINDDGELILPSGTTAQRPASPENGMIRYNTTIGQTEFFNGSWNRVRRGNLSDWAYKEGPISFNSNYRNNWNMGEAYGSSLDATTHGFGILVNETGEYWFEGWQRTGNTQFGGLALNGDRSALENQSFNVWSHDHSGSTNNWSKSICVGTFQAGWIITFGPAVNYSSGVVYSTAGFAGCITAVRLD